MSDHEAQYIILNNFFLVTEDKNGKYKNTFKVRLITSETVCYFQEQLSQESWENVFPTNDVNSNFNNFLSTFHLILKLVFLVYIWVIMKINVGLHKALENLVNGKEVCIRGPMVK